MKIHSPFMASASFSSALYRGEEKWTMGRSINAWGPNLPNTEEPGPILVSSYIRQITPCTRPFSPIAA